MLIGRQAQAGLQLTAADAQVQPLIACGTDQWRAVAGGCELHETCGASGCGGAGCGEHAALGLSSVLCDPAAQQVGIESVGLGNGGRASTGLGAGSNHLGFEGCRVVSAFAARSGELCIASSVHVSIQNEVDTMVSG